MPGPFDGGARRRPRPRPPRARGHAPRRGADAARRHAAQPSNGRGTRSGSLWRMQVLRDALRASAGSVTRCWLLRYARRGWNGGTTRSPVPDARWALDQVRAAYGDVPVVLVGHSMGGRASRAGRRRPQRPWRGRPGPVVRRRRPGHRAGRQGPGGRSRPARPDHLGPRQPGVHRARRCRRRPRASSTRSGAPVTTCCTGRGGWNRFALRHSLDVLARAEDRSDPVE